MRPLMLFAIVFAACVALVIGCVPSQTTASLHDPLAEVHDWPSDSTQPLRVCDDRGICCYTIYRTGSISCVATKIIVQVSPGGVRDERDDEGSAQIVGEAPDGQLGARLLRNYRFRAD